MSIRDDLPGGIGLWAGFLDSLAAADAIAAAQTIEAARVGTIWLQEYSGVDPFIRAALYLGATERLVVGLGVATVHARDPHAMVAAAATLHEAFPGRFILGLGVSHRHLVQGRGQEYPAPIATLTAYLEAMTAAAGARALPARVVGALGPKMLAVAGRAADGAHTYFAPVSHTATARAAIGPHRWLAPTQMVGIGPADRLRRYLGLCLSMPNYQRNLLRHGLTQADLDTTSDLLVDALIVPDAPGPLTARLASQRAAGADHVVVQFVPPPPAAVVLDRLVAAGGVAP